MVCVNKWDIAADKSERAIKHFEEAIRSRFAPFTDFPIVFTSAITKQRIHRALEEAQKVYENRHRTVPTSKLNTVMQEAIAAYPPPANKGKYVKIKYISTAHQSTFSCARNSISRRKAHASAPRHQAAAVRSLCMWP